MEPPAGAETPPPLAIANTEPVVEAKQEMDNEITPPAELAAQSVAPVAATEVPSPLIKDQQSSSSLSPAAASTTPPAETINEVDTKVGDTVDAPVGPAASLAAQEAPVKTEEPQAAPAPAEKGPEKEEKKMEEVKKLEKGEQESASTKLEPAIEVATTVTPVSVAKEDVATKTATEISQPPPSAHEPAAPQTQSAVPSTAPEPEPTPAETAEPLLPNGLPQDSEALSEDMAFSDTTPVDKPDACQSQESTPVAKTVMPAQEEEEKEKKEEEKETEKSEDSPPTTVSCPTEESTTMQGRVELLFLLAFMIVMCHAGLM